MNLKYLIRMPAILISGILAGTIFLWLAFLIPDKLIYEHGAESVEIFTGEGLYPFVGNTPAEELDNWTDSLMIHTACYQKGRCVCFRECSRCLSTGLSGCRSNYIISNGCERDR